MCAADCDDYRERLGEAFTEVCEAFLFMFAEPAEDGLPKDIAHLEACISFSGVFSGQICIVAPYAWCSLMAANALGTEPELIDTCQSADALKELANVVCGHFLTTAFGETRLLELGLPVLRMLPVEEVRMMHENGQTQVFQVEDSVVMLSYQIVPSKGV